MTKAATPVIKHRPRKVSNLPVRGHRVGCVADYRDGTWLVTFAERATPIPARTTLTHLTAVEMQAAAASRSEALIVFENESPDRPIVVGLLAEPHRTPSAARSEGNAEIDARVDGKRVTISGNDEIVLRCGQASITLRRNGRIVLRGTYLETRARGVNRIKGGTVQIN